MVQVVEREFTDRKVRGSNPTSSSRLPLSRLGQPGSIPALVLPLSGTAVRHRKGAIAERFFRILAIDQVAGDLFAELRNRPEDVSLTYYCNSSRLKPMISQESGPETGFEGSEKALESSTINVRACLTEDPLFDSNLGISVAPPRLGQPGSISTLVLPSGGIAAGHQKYVTHFRCLDATPTDGSTRADTLSEFSGLDKSSEDAPQTQSNPEV
ncbi:hypothetical protein CSKR_111136 [Clonorchis sinensis]|uniref:Uncharacterized protein n=1 Tax=Clonorchis sinensis TaxID=79923 RepID=A0A419Q3S6_CLOSI|nr:hypothetical protein CSKR_111136 [Clonorchis sinensis]